LGTNRLVRDRSGDPAGRGTGGGPSRPSKGDVLAERRRARNRSLVRDGILLLLVSVALLVAWQFRLTPNEDRPPAVELSQRFDTLFVELWDDPPFGSAPTEVAPGIEGGRFAVSARPRWVLTGRAGSDCYALWWDEDGVRRGRTLPRSMPCEPSRTATSPLPQHFDRIGRAVDDPAAPYLWGPILPDPLRYRFWFFPALIVGAGVGVATATRMVIAILIDNTPSAVRR
jgi:hypothetical protein